MATFIALSEPETAGVIGDAAGGRARKIGAGRGALGHAGYRLGDVFLILGDSPAGRWDS